MPGYDIENYQSFRITDEGERELLANFIGEITDEVRYVDGQSSQTVLTIRAQQFNPEDPETPIELPPVEVPAENYSSLSWVLQSWGVRAVIRPGTSVKDDLRAMIQLRSRPRVTTIYKHLGWTKIGNSQKYLHAGGAIGKSGNDASVQVRLSNELSRFNLATEIEPEEAVSASLDLLNVTSPEIMWPLLAATLAPLYGPCDFAIHLAGRTGTFKSEVMSLCQSHYGIGMDSRHLPGSWSSTANALEAQTFFAKNAAFVIDDFVPSGTSYQVRAYQQTADKVIRAQGNQTGRARLTDMSSLQQTMYPRGLILSTGEDVPEGHSVRGRMLILELTPGDIQPATLSVAQKQRAKYVGTVAALAQRLAGTMPDLTDRVEQLRNSMLDTGHTRTPSMLARLIATAEDFIDFAAELGVYSDKSAKSEKKRAAKAIQAAGAKQAQYLEEADPVEQFTAAIRQAVAVGNGHFRTLAGGTPRGAEMMGWTREEAKGEMPLFRSRGPTIGWVDVEDDELYLDVTAGYAVIKKVAGSELTLTKQTLFKRMKDSGVLLRADEARQRNTIRITAEMHPRQVLAMALSSTLELKEKP